VFDASATDASSAIDASVSDVARPDVQFPQVDAALDGSGFVDPGGAACGDDRALSVLHTGQNCNVTIASWPDDGHSHVAPDSPVQYCTYPPSSGTHYWDWANYLTYDKPIPPGYLVHSLEHGAIVITYACASQCPAVAAQLQAVIDAQPLDPLCNADAGVPRRMILAPDPNLDVPVAAAAWTWTYRAMCVDPTTLTAFIQAHYAAPGTEVTCAAGVNPP
jgi:hypothetical protein